MKIKAKRKLSKKKVKKTEKLISVSNNYHIKKVDNTILKDEKLSEKDIKEKLKNIYQLIKKNTYEKKPIELYLNITESPLVNENDKKSLNKISSITQYKLISPIEILYKYNYEKINKISNEKDKCSICQFNFYEDEEIDELKNSKKKNDSELGEFEDLIKKEIDVVLLNNCHDHFFHIECLNNLIGEKIILNVQIVL